jgi:lysophospholipase L1-like esterase
METVDPDSNEIRWVDVRDLYLEGKGWMDTLAPFDRLPGRAKGTVRDPVWNLSRHSAGMCVHFATDASAIRARWTLTQDRLAMSHMAATGVSGLDLYVKADQQWRWVGVGRPEVFPTNEGVLVDSIPEGVHEYRLYLPLYNGVTSVMVGIEKYRSIRVPEAVSYKPIVFYGTSITHGGCASRPGMCHPAILGRRLDRPIINLGFSGNGTMDLELATLFAELDPCVYVIDCLPNMAAEQITERAGAFVKILREAHSETPILLVEDRTYSRAFFVASQRRRNQTSRAALREVYDGLMAEGVPHLHYLSGEGLLRDDGEGTVDGSHPTDLGFVQQADAFEPVLRPLV